MEAKRVLRWTLPHLQAPALALIALLGIACPASDDPFRVGDRATPTTDTSSGAPTGTYSPVPTKTAEEMAETAEAAEAAHIQKQFAPTKGVIRLGDSSDSKPVQLENAIASYIIVHGYDYAVELAVMTPEEHQAALPAGELDVLMEVSRAESANWYQKNTESGAIVDIGSVRKGDSDQRIAIAHGLKERAGEVVEFLARMTPGDQIIDDLAGTITSGRAGVRPVVAALVFLKNHEEMWTRWVPADVAEKVTAAIVAGRTSLVNRLCVPMGNDPWKKGACN